MQKYTILVFALCVSMLCRSISFAYDSDKMHPRIAENAVIKSKMDDYLKNNLKFSGGITEEKNAKQIIEIINNGSISEDSPFERTGFHFHNPLRPWEKAGLFGGDSSVVWAQKYNQGSSGTYSWHTARDAYYQALTTNSDDDFELAFRSLGQVMHLIADAAVPAHVRSDAHITYLGGDDYENAMTQWAEANGNRPEYFAGYEVSQDIFDYAVLDPSAPVPISALWDRNIYDGKNPQDTLDSLIGLAEYTNANFITEDTAFSNFPHPIASDTNYNVIDWWNPEIHDSEDGIQDNKVYIYHNSGHRLATVSYLTWIILVKHHVFSGLLVDDLVLQDYASLLIPRAVGYSAALLDYFFRGEVEIVPNQGGGYFITNKGEEYLTGTFALYYDDINGVRNPVEGAEWANVTLAGGGSSALVDFDPPTEPEPAAPGAYILVFRGAFGNEDDAVVGRVVELGGKYIVIHAGKWVTVWDVYNDEVAQTIRDASGKEIIFPVLYTDLSTWLSETKVTRISSGPSINNLFYTTIIGDIDWDWSDIDFDSIRCPCSTAENPCEYHFIDTVGSDSWELWGQYDQNPLACDPAVDEHTYCIFNHHVERHDKFVHKWKHGPEVPPSYRLHRNQYRYGMYFFYPYFVSSLKISALNHAGGFREAVVSENMQSTVDKYSCVDDESFCSTYMHRNVDSQFIFTVTSPFDANTAEATFEVEHNQRYGIYGGNYIEYHWSESSESAGKTFHSSVGAYSENIVSYVYLMHYQKFLRECTRGVVGDANVVAERLGFSIFRPIYSEDCNEAYVTYLGEPTSFVQAGVLAVDDADSVDAFSLGRNTGFENAIADTILMAGSDNSFPGSVIVEIRE